MAVHLMGQIHLTYRTMEGQSVIDRFTCEWGNRRRGDAAPRLLFHLEVQKWVIFLLNGSELPGWVKLLDGLMFGRRNFRGTKGLWVLIRFR